MFYVVYFNGKKVGFVVLKYEGIPKTDQYEATVICILNGMGFIDSGDYLSCLPGYDSKDSLTISGDPTRVDCVIANVGSRNQDLQIWFMHTFNDWYRMTDSFTNGFSSVVGMYLIQPTIEEATSLGLFDGAPHEDLWFCSDWSET